MRGDQLSFRKHEIYYAFDAFNKLVSGEEQLCVHDGSAADIDWESWCRVRLKSVKAPVNCDQLALVGHSFGGATIVSALHLVLRHCIFISSCAVLPSISRTT
jgi:platelet-activating factor acetylhydrolase